MLQRGRKSDSGLVVGLPVIRLETPAELTTEQGKVWRDVIAAKPTDWFDSANAPLLLAYCRHVIEEKRLSQQINEFKTEWLTDDEYVKRYDLLTRLHERQSKLALGLAKQMRLTQQSKYRADKANTGPTLKKRPWESQEG